MNTRIRIERKKERKKEYVIFVDFRYYLIFMNYQEGKGKQNFAR
jgi:hypothetical protein